MEPVAASSTPFLNSGILVVLQDNLTATHKQDIHNSLLISQLAADRKFNRHDEVREWYHMFSSTLGNIGWVVDSNDFLLNQPADPTFNLASLALNEVARTGEEVHTFRKVANLLQRLPEDSDLLELLYKGRTDSSMGATIMMAVGRLTTGGSLTMKMYIVTVVATCEGTRKYLAHIYDSESVQFDKDMRSSEMMQNELQFNNVRDFIIAKLSTRPSTMVKEINLEPPKMEKLQPSCPATGKEDKPSSSSSSISTNSSTDGGIPGETSDRKTFVQMLELEPSSPVAGEKGAAMSSKSASGKSSFSVGQSRFK